MNNEEIRQVIWQDISVLTQALKQEMPDALRWEIMERYNLIIPYLGQHEFNASQRDLICWLGQQAKDMLEAPGWAYLRDDIPY